MNKQPTIVPNAWGGGYAVIDGEDVHEAKTHAEALSIRESLVRERAFQQHEGGIDYD